MERLNNAGTRPELEDETFPGEPVMVRGSAAPEPINPDAGSLDEATDRYELRRSLGRGSMGEVHLCHDASVGRDVAMKVLLPAHRPDPQLRARFLREARVQGQLEHPSIVPVYDLGVDAMGATYFTMKRLRGLTLGEIVRGLREKSPEVTRQFPLRRLLAAFAAVCLTVDFAHSRGVLHRDLKPSNIMLGDFGEVYVLDWGLAKLKELSDHDAERAVRDPSSDEIHTAAGRILGTFGYMAPEQLHGQVMPAADIYSLGATMVALAGGIEPEDVPRKGLRMDLAKALPSLEPTFRHVLEEMTETDPDKRPQRARDVVALLAKAKPARTARDERTERALTRQPTQELGPRKLFGDVQEPLGTLLRIGVLGFGAGGWAGMMGIRLSLAIVIGIASVFAFPARTRLRGVGKELDTMLSEGQGGFVDMMKGAMARRS